MLRQQDHENSTESLCLANCWNSGASTWAEWTRGRQLMIDVVEVLKADPQLLHVIGAFGAARRFRAPGRRAVRAMRIPMMAITNGGGGGGGAWQHLEHDGETRHEKPPRLHVKCGFPRSNNADKTTIASAPPVRVH